MVVRKEIKFSENGKIIKKEIDFEFKDLNKRFEANRIIRQIINKYPDLLELSEKKKKSTTEALKASEAFEELGFLLFTKFCESPKFKDQEEVETYFNYSYEEFMSLTGEVLGFIMKSMESTS